MPRQRALLARHRAPRGKAGEARQEHRAAQSWAKAKSRGERMAYRAASLASNDSGQVEWKVPTRASPARLPPPARFAAFGRKTCAPLQTRTRKAIVAARRLSHGESWRP